jgi:hypothetical protein
MNKKYPDEFKQEATGTNGNLFLNHLILSFSIHILFSLNNPAFLIFTGI